MAKTRREKAQEFLDLPASALPAADWQQQGENFDSGGAWRELRAVAKDNRDWILGEPVIVRADRDGWRDWQVI